MYIYLLTLALHIMAMSLGVYLFVMSLFFGRYEFTLVSIFLMFYAVSQVKKDLRR